MSFRSRKFHNFMEKCMIKNFLFRPTSANMLHHPFVRNIKNEGHIIESLKKHLTGIIKKRQKKGSIYELSFYWNDYSDASGTYSFFFFFQEKYLFLRIKLKVKVLMPSILSFPTNVPCALNSLSLASYNWQAFIFTNTSKDSGRILGCANFIFF